MRTPLASLSSSLSRSTLLVVPWLLAAGAAASACSADGGAAHESPTRASSAALASRIDVAPSALNYDIGLLLLGSRLQVSNTGNGTPLPGDGAMSYFQVGAGLTTQRPDLASKALDIPSKVQDLGAKVVAGQFFGQGGLFLVDKIRIDLNDLNVDFDLGKVTVTTDVNGITAKVKLDSEHPSLKCYGNTWLPALFIPIGWQDSTCPDLDMSNIVVTARFVPSVDASSRLAIGNVAVTFDADIDGGTVGNGIGAFYDYRTKLKNDFEARFQAYLADEKFEGAVASTLMALVSRQAGEPVTSYQSVTVDGDGLHVTPGTVCTPKTCAQAGAGCGIASVGCGVVLDCGGCPSGEACGAGATANQCVACPPLVCGAGACGTIYGACGDSAVCNACPAGQTCESNRCTTCQPRCTGKKCGAPNGCGGTCAGSCPGLSDSLCNWRQAGQRSPKTMMK